MYAAPKTQLQWPHEAVNVKIKQDAYMLEIQLG